MVCSAMAASVVLMQNATLPTAIFHKTFVLHHALQARSLAFTQMIVSVLIMVNVYMENVLITHANMCFLGGVI